MKKLALLLMINEFVPTYGTSTWAKMTAGRKIGTGNNMRWNTNFVLEQVISITKMTDPLLALWKVI